MKGIFDEFDLDIQKTMVSGRDSGAEHMAKPVPF
jgi:hypothetical protein